MHIGLIGGIGPAATDVYYRGLIKHAATLGRDLELTVVHADAPTLIGHLGTNNQDAQCAIYQRLTERLKRAGADVVVVTSIAGHFCIDRFAVQSPLPIVDLTEALSDWLMDQGLKTVGILGTNTVMASGMYGKLPSVDVLAPEGSGLEEVHQAYVTLAMSGQSTQALQKVFFEAGQALVARGADAVLLGGTDLNAAFAGAQSGFDIVDCAQIHIDKVATLI